MIIPVGTGARRKRQIEVIPMLLAHSAGLELPAPNWRSIPMRNLLEYAWRIRVLGSQV
jgi:hypothetical protein